MFCDVHDWLIINRLSFFCISITTSIETKKCTRPRYPNTHTQHRHTLYHTSVSRWSGALCSNAKSTSPPLYVAVIPPKATIHHSTEKTDAKQLSCEDWNDSVHYLWSSIMAYWVYLMLPSLSLDCCFSLFANLMEK